MTVLFGFTGRKELVEGPVHVGWAVLEIPGLDGQRRIQDDAAYAVRVVARGDQGQTRPVRQAEQIPLVVGQDIQQISEVRRALNAVVGRQIDTLLQLPVTARGDGLAFLLAVLLDRQIGRERLQPGFVEIGTEAGFGEPGAPLIEQDVVPLLPDLGDHTRARPVLSPAE